VGYCRNDLPAEDFDADGNAYGRLTAALAAAPDDAAGPGDPAHVLRLAGHVHAQLARMAWHAHSEGVPEGRAWDLAGRALDAALGGPDAVRALTTRPFDPEALRRAGAGSGVPAKKLRALVAGWSEQDWLSYHANLWRHNMETTGRTYCARQGWDYEDATSAWRRGAAVGRLQGLAFARAVDDLMAVTA
jgi:hypothetical protein